MAEHSQPLACALCGHELLRERDVRYEVKVEIKAAYDPLRLSEEDLHQDFRSEIAKLLRQLEGLSAEEAQDQIYRVYEFNLCPGCQRKVVAELGRIRLGGT